ncbi:MAG: ankyrin repeat domain-containing protein, partial [Candidatus Sericytochromatia bacterium]
NLIYQKNIRGESPISLAVWFKDSKAIKIILENAKSININEKFSGSPDILLNHVIKEKELNNLIDLVLSKNPDLNMIDNSNNKAFIYAVYSGNKEIIEKLINKDENIINFDYVSINPINIAIEKGNIDFLEYIIDLGFDFSSEKLLEEFIRKENKDLIDLFFKKNKIIRDKFAYNILSSNTNNTKIFDQIFSKISDINKIQDNGKTIITQAIEDKQTDLYNLLIAKNIDLLKKDSFGENALSLSIKTNNLKLLERIESKNIDLNQKFNDGISKNRNILMLSINTNISSDIIDFILNTKKIDINEQDEYGETALMLASKNNVKASLNLLLKNKANINIKNKLEEDALSISRRYKNTEIEKILVEYEKNEN